MGKNGKTAEEKKPGMLERARKMVSGNGHDEEQMVNNNGRMVPVSEVPKASDLDRANEFLGKAKTGGRMSPQVQLKALDFALKPDKDQLKSATFLQDRHIFYMATALTWEAIARNDKRPYMEIWSTEFMELRRSLDGYMAMATMRQAGVDTEADAITRMGRL
jgi:hypothetical protein